MGGEAVGAGGVDVLRGGVGVELFDEAGEAVAEGVAEVAHAAEEGVGVDGFFEVAGGVEGGFAEHVVDDESAFEAGDFAAFHGVAAFDVVGAGEVAEGAVFEAHVELGGGPDGSAFS